MLHNYLYLLHLSQSQQYVSTNIEDGADLVGNLYFQEFDKVILYQKNIEPDFFALKNGIAGEVLQKFSTYHIRLAIIGDFSNQPSKSLQDVIYESNKGRQIHFVASQKRGVNAIVNVTGSAFHLTS